METIQSVISPVTGAEINVSELCAAVRRLASESPLNIYLPAIKGGKCRYSSGECKDGSIGCIVGQALRAIGLDPAAFDNAEVLAPSAAKVVGDLGGNWGPGAWLLEVQRGQDAGRSWRVAVADADEQGELRAK